MDRETGGRRELGVTRALKAPPRAQEVAAELACRVAGPGLSRR